MGCRQAASHVACRGSSRAIALTKACFARHAGTAVRLPHGRSAFRPSRMTRSGVMRLRQHGLSRRVGDERAATAVARLCE